jgi:hypothetical protein
VLQQANNHCWDHGCHIHLQQQIATTAQQQEVTLQEASDIKLLGAAAGQPSPLAPWLSHPPAAADRHSTRLDIELELPGAAAGQLLQLKTWL